MDYGLHIQDAMPNVPAHDRKFIKTGITPEQWDKLFGVADEDDPVRDPIPEEVWEDMMVDLEEEIA